LVEQLRYNLLFRWFVGLCDRRCGVGSLGVLEEPRSVAGAREVEAFFTEVMQLADARGLLSKEHFSGSILER